MAKTLTSFRVLPSGRSVIPTPKAEESSQGFIREKAFSSEVARWLRRLWFRCATRFVLRGSQIAKTLTSFRVLPFGLA